MNKPLIGLNIATFFVVIGSFILILLVGNYVKESLRILERLDSSIVLMRVDLDSLQKYKRDYTAIYQRIIKPLALHESKFDPYALGDSGNSFGLCQIQMPTAKELLLRNSLSISDLYNPYVNIFLACEKIEELSKKFLKIEYIFGAYSGGLRYDSLGVRMINYESYIKPLIRRIKSARLSKMG